MKRLILVGGTMGVGKTARALRLRARASSRADLPHGECWLAERSESKQLSGAVGIHFSADGGESETGVSVNLLVLFSLRRKVHIFLLWQGENVCFSLQKEKHQKNCKRTA